MTQEHEAAEPGGGAEIRAIMRARGLVDLFARRPELAGVYSPAELTAEAVRWSA